MTTNGREGGSLKASSWKIVVEKLKTEHSFIIDQKQMKNHYDYLKGKFATWLKLKNKTGNVYDPVTNTFNLTDEEWELEKQSNKYVANLKVVPLVFPDLCTLLFEGATASGFQSWGPSSTNPPLQSQAKDVVCGVDDGDDDVMMETQSEKEPQVESQECSSHSKTKGTKQKGRDGGKDKGVGGNIIDQKILEVGDEMCKDAKALVEVGDIEMDNCMAKLEGLGWGESDPRYETALLLFAETTDVRKVSLRLKTTSCELWVRNAGGKYGLFRQL